MKIRCIQVSILLLNGIMSVLYFFLKLFPVKQGKILFCSRQSNDTPLDFILIQNEIKQIMPESNFVVICAHINHTAKGYATFFIKLLKSMYHLATSSICVLDSYWPTVSMLKHKKQLKVIQIWHSLGKTKKSGYQALGKKSGRKREFAHFLKMHKNYDYLIGGAPVWNKYYCEAFDISEDKILNYGLPRADYLIDTAADNKKRFFEQFPKLRGKKIVLYAPTFRRNMKSHWDKITESKYYDDIAIIVKNHPGQVVSALKKAPNIYYLEDWKTIDLIAVCDYMITDYSSISLEAAVLKKKTFYWTYDYDEYMNNSGLNFNLKGELADNVFEDIDELMYCIEHDRYNIAQQEAYIKKYLPAELGNATKKVASLIEQLAEEQQVKDYAIGDNGRWQGKPVAESFNNIQALGENKWGTFDLQDDQAAAYDSAQELGNHSNVS